MGRKYVKRVSGLLLMLFFTVGVCVRSSATDAEEKGEEWKKQGIRGSYVFTGVGEGTDANGLGKMKFCMYRKNAEGTYEPVSEKVYETDSKGRIVINGLTVGEYRLHETEAPPGYGIISVPVPFVIEENGVSATDGTRISGRPAAGTLQCFKLPSAPSVMMKESAGDKEKETVFTILPNIPTDIMIYEKYKIRSPLGRDFQELHTEVFAGEALDSMKSNITGKCDIKNEGGILTVDMSRLTNYLSQKAVEIRVTVSTEGAGSLEVVNTMDAGNRAAVEYTTAYGISGCL